MALEEDLDMLYSVPPGEFLDRRKALAQALRKAGRRDDAAAVAGAAKPTPAAWACNQLARRHPDEMAELASAGERLRGLLRASFTGQADPGAMAEARSEQREVVARLARLAGQILEAAGAPRSETVLERVSATLTTLSTTGAWGGQAPGRLARELEPPGIEALAALVGDVASSAARETAPVESTAGAAEVRREGPEQEKGAAREKEEAQKKDRARQEEEQARRAAEEARARIERAEAASRAAGAAEEQARAAADRARAAASAAASARAEREVAAREARRLAEEQAQAAEEARRRAEDAALAARNAEDEAVLAAQAERAAKDELSAAEKAVARAAAESVAAEEAVVRERRARSRPPA